MIETANTIDLERMTDGYITAALWADCLQSCQTCMAGTWQTSRITGDVSFRHGDGTVEHYYECETCEEAETGGMEFLEVSDADRLKIREMIGGWCAQNRSDLELYAQRREFDSSEGTVWDHAGHDLRLTAGGHGAGFLDRGLGDLGDRLSEAAKGFSDVGCWQVSETHAQFDVR